MYSAQLGSSTAVLAQTPPTPEAKAREAALAGGGTHAPRDRASNRAPAL